VAVCSDLEPYRDAVTPWHDGVLFGRTDELEAILARLIADAGLRAHIARTAYEEIARPRQEREHAPARLALYRRWGATAGAGDGAGWPDVAAASADGRYLRLDGDPAARLLLEALRLAREGRTAAAVEACGEAAGMAPGFHLPHLQRGTIDPDGGAAIAALRAAVRLDPGSPAAAFALATRLEERGDVAGAIEWLGRAAALAPALGAAQLRLGALAERAGRIEAACGHYEAALAANPYLAPAAMRVAAAAADRGDTARAADVLERAADRDRHLPLLPLFLGQVLLGVGRAAEARRHLERALALGAEPTAVLAQLARAHLALGNVRTARRLLGEAQGAAA
jgi:tetratricopeptide (TPR) repeat protein